MPPVLKKKAEAAPVDVPDTVKPFISLGLGLSYRPGKEELLCDCPLCGREGKFSLNTTTGQWRCFIGCGDGDKGGGGIYTFLKAFHEVCRKSTSEAAYIALAKDRSLDFPETLEHWGLVKSPLNDHWLVPGWGVDYHGTLMIRQLYTYKRVKDRMMLLPLGGGTKHCLLGVQNYDESKPIVDTCEGIWDAMKWYEVLNTYKIQGNSYGPTSFGSTASLFANTNVLAAPTCSAFNEGWDKWYKGKQARFLFDNDYPRQNPQTKELMVPSGTAGMKRATIRLNQRASEVSYLKWGDEGYDPNLPDGYDLRDALKDKVKGLILIFNRLEPVPEDWLEVTATADGELSPRGCTEWRVLINSWRKAMKWTPGLEHALGMMLACVVSTKSVGDQLWIKVIGPAACGKSTLCEALTVNKQYVKALSTIRGFHSGYKSSPGGDEDNSLIPLIQNKTFITKDGDTLLQAPNLGQILSEARDIYDRVSRTHYRNSISREYEGLSTTWILCGTSSLRGIDSSELGERFLDVVVMDKIDTDLEDDILKRVARKALSNVALETDGDARSHQSVELCEAMELTGGYVNWLRENANRVINTIGVSEEALTQCTDLAKWVAYLRARPSEHQKENPERELGTRLTSVLVRASVCLAAVMNRKNVDDEVMRRVQQVAMDTARGLTLDIVKLLYKDLKGMPTKAFNIHINLPEHELKALLRFLYGIGVIRYVKEKPAEHSNREVSLWKLSNIMIELCRKLGVNQVS